MIETSRRGFLKLGTAGTAALTLGAGVASLTGCSRQPMTDAGFRILTASDVEFLSALAPVILTDSAYPGPLGDKGRDRLLHGLDEVLLTLQKHAQEQLQLAFMLMGSPVTRVVSDAPLSSWADASREDAEHFLNAWKTSLLPIKRMGYAGICKLFEMVWYAQPENFALTGYPGPPKKIPYPYPATTSATTSAAAE